MKTVVFDDELVLSIADVAKRLKAALGWMSCEPDGEECSIRFTVSDGRRFEMDKHGLAYEIDERGETKVDPDERESILIPDVLNYPETMWAHDTDGKWVLVVMPYD